MGLYMAWEKFNLVEQRKQIIVRTWLADSIGSGKNNTTKIGTELPSAVYGMLTAQFEPCPILYSHVTVSRCFPSFGFSSISWPAIPTPSSSSLGALQLFCCGLCSWISYSAFW